MFGKIDLREKIFTRLGYFAFLAILLLSISSLKLYQDQKYISQTQSAYPSTSPSPTPTPIPVKNSYSPKDLGFSFSVPSDMETYCSKYECSFTREKEAKIASGQNFIYVSRIPKENAPAVIYNTQDTDFLLQLEIGMSGSTRKGMQTESQFVWTRLQNVKVDDFDGKVFENKTPWEFPKGTLERRIIVQKEDSTFVIGGYLGGSIPLTEFNQIVSAFKFTNSTSWASFLPSVDTSNWKTYRSTIEGFTIKYPPDWKFESSMPTSGGVKESMTLTSPKNFVFKYFTQVAPFDGGCSDCKIGDVEKLTFIDHEPLYLAQETSAGIPSIVLTEKEVKKGESTWAYPFLKSRFTPSDEEKKYGARSGYSIYGSYKQPEDFPYHVNKVDPKEFTNKEDVITAITILRSLSF